MYIKESKLSLPKKVHQHTSSTWSPTRKLVFTAIMTAIAALLQAAGGYLPGIGFFISPFTTLPILLATLISFRYGFLLYLLTICLLLLIEPSELFIFPFTTGLLGLSMGWGFLKLQRCWEIVGLSGLILFLGICFPLYVLGFPVFGPITSSFSFPIVTSILGFSILYSWLWFRLSLFFIRRLENVLL